MRNGCKDTVGERPDFVPLSVEYLNAWLATRSGEKFGAVTLSSTWPDMCPASYDARRHTTRKRPASVDPHITGLFPKTSGYPIAFAGFRP